MVVGFPYISNIIQQVPPQSSFEVTVMQKNERRWNMPKCIKCGKKGIFLRVNSKSLCSQCVENEIKATENFIHELSQHIKPALNYTTILPSLGKNRIHEQYSHCQYVLEHIDDWKSVPYFNEAFNRTLVQGRLFKESPLFPHRTIQDYSPIDYEKLFQELKRDISKVSTDCILAEYRAYDYSEIFRVVGVTFKNGRKSRQTILRKIRFGDPPYDNVEFELRRHIFNNEDAVGVFANEDQVGNISRSDLPWLLDHWEEYYCVAEYDVCGGRGYYYGLDIRVGFRHNSDILNNT